MTKKLVILVLTVLAIGTVLWLHRRTEEKEVYEVLIRRFGIPVEEYSRAGIGGVELAADLPASHPLSILNRIPELQEIMRDFQNHNRKAYRLKYYLPPLPNEYWINTDVGYDLPDGTNWTTLSRTGFNRTYTKALVYVGTFTKVEGTYISCTESFVYLTKVQNSWNVAEIIPVSVCGLP